MHGQQDSPEGSFVEKDSDMNEKFAIIVSIK